MAYVIDSIMFIATAAATALICQYYNRKLRSNERVLCALVEQLQDSECDAFQSEPVTNGRVVSLERTPASRTSAVPRPTGGRPFSVAQDPHPARRARRRSTATSPD